MTIKSQILTFENWIDISKGASWSEFEWIGIDNSGQIGVFSSASMGYIPPKVFSSYDAYIVCDSVLYGLPVFTNAKLFTKESGRFDDWLDFSTKGLFGCDYQDIHRKLKFDRYDLISIPEKPLLVDALPEIEAFNEIVPRFNISFNGDLSFSQLREAEYE